MKDEKIMMIKRGSLFLGIFLVLLSLYFLICLFYSHTPNSLIWVHEAYSIKENSANGVNGSKILILAGSNAHFGISAENMSNQLGIMTINYGLHVGLLTYHFERAKKILHPGDVVLMPLEYEFFWYDHKKLFDEQPVYARYILTYDPEYFHELRYFEKIDLIMVQFLDLLANIRQNFMIPEQTYKSITINRFGDETYYDEPKNLSTLQPTQMQNDFHRGHDCVDDIVEFAKWCRQNNITLIATFPSSMKFTEYYETENRLFFDKVIEFYKENNIIVLGTPQEYFFEPEYFYDTAYHLTDIGKKKRTEMTISELRDNEVIRSMIGNINQTGKNK